jgi:hypothetical protein
LEELSTPGVGAKDGVGIDGAEPARAAARPSRWERAFEAFTALDATETLGAADLEALGEHGLIEEL